MEVCPFLAPLAEGQRGLCHGSSIRRAYVHESINSILVSVIETTFLYKSGPKLYEVFMGTRSWMSSIESDIRPVTSELLPLRY